MDEYLFLSLYLYIFTVFALIAGLVFTKLIGPNRPNNAKNRIYESGIVNIYGSVNSSINVRYYLIAIIFVLFDIEAVFMYPWAVNLRELGGWGVIEMFIFMGVLIIGLVYIYKKRILRWE